MLYAKSCDCGAEFASTGPAARYCPTCVDIRKQEIRTENRLRNERSRRSRGARVGRGALPGTEHPNYKHGYYVAQTQSRKYKEKVRYCERCNEDLIDADRWSWVMHHRDHNHSNHDEANLELLCKRCHQLEHECYKNLFV